MLYACIDIVPALQRLIPWFSCLLKFYLNDYRKNRVSAVT